MTVLQARGPTPDGVPAAGREVYGNVIARTQGAFSDDDIDGTVEAARRAFAAVA